MSTRNPRIEGTSDFAAGGKLWRELLCLGNMGAPMFKNLVKADHSLVGFDRNPDASKNILGAGGRPAKSIGDACADAEIVVSMLPSGKQVRDVYLEPGGVLASSRPGTLLLDWSTIDIESARTVDAKASKRGFEMLDAPVSGGVAGAQAGTLTFMVGGSEIAFAKARPILEARGKTIVHTGKCGSGQAARSATT